MRRIWGFTLGVALASSGCETGDTEASASAANGAAADAGATDGGKQSGTSDRRGADGEDGAGSSSDRVTDAIDGGDGADSSGGDDGYGYADGYDYAGDGYDVSDASDAADAADAADGYDGADAYDGASDAADAYDTTDGFDVYDVADVPGMDGGSGGPNDGADFVDVGTNPFVLADADSLSTFAIDVDSASYDYFRMWAQLGSLPPAKSVRLEEYVNSFVYGYPGPNAGDSSPFAVHLAGAASPYAPGVSLVRIGIQAARLEDLPKKDTNLVFLVDVSGSMQNQMSLVRTLLTSAVDALDPTDHVSIVTYAGSTGVVLAPTAVANANSIKSVISGLGSGGSTAGAAGITLAYQQAEAAFVEGGINHVLLLTDGDFNVGVSSTSALKSLIVEKRKTGVTLTALGFGLGANDVMMETLSNAGNGTYAAITDSDNAVQYAHQRLVNDMTFVAQDVKIQVAFNPAQVLAWRLLGYEDRAIADEDFTDDTIDAGEIGAGHDVTAIYEVVLAGGEVPLAASFPPDATPMGALETPEFEADGLLEVAIRYKAPGALETDPADSLLRTLKTTELATSATALDESFHWAAAVAAFAECVHGSPYAHAGWLDIVEAELLAYQGTSADRQELVFLFGEVKSALSLQLFGP